MHSTFLFLPALSLPLLGTGEEEGEREGDGVRSSRLEVSREGERLRRSGVEECDSGNGESMPRERVDAQGEGESLSERGNNLVLFWSGYKHLVSL